MNSRSIIETFNTIKILLIDQKNNDRLKKKKKDLREDASSSFLTPNSTVRGMREH